MGGGGCLHPMQQHCPAASAWLRKSTMGFPTIVETGEINDGRYRSVDVQDAVDALAAELAQPVLVEDPRHRPLWWSTQDDVDETRRRTILQRKITPAAEALVARLGLAAAERPVRTPAAPEADMLPRWCVPIRSGRDLFGYLWVLDADGRVTEADLPKLVACADIAALTLARTRSSPEGHDRHRDALLARLALEPDADAARELIALEDLDPGATVVVNAPLTAGGWVLRTGMSVHVDPAPNAAATSGPPVPLVELSVAVHRAASTLQAIRAGGVFTRPAWDALGGWHLIVAAPPGLTVADVHPGADVLASRPQMMLTARTVLDHGGDIAASAAELHIHRTTLYYRIERIEALTGVNLKTSGERDDLHLALRLAAYRRAAD
jgi:hypothetical protein